MFSMVNQPGYPLSRFGSQKMAYSGMIVFPKFLHRREIRKLKILDSGKSGSIIGLNGVRLLLSGY